MYLERSPEEVLVIETNEELEVIRTVLAVTSYDRLPFIPYPGGTRRQHKVLARHVDKLLYNQRKEGVGKKCVMSPTQTSLALNALRRCMNDERISVWREARLFADQLATE